MSPPGNMDFICRIDASNTLVAAGDCWNHLLRHGAPEYPAPAPFLGKRLWTHLGDSTTVHLFQALTAKVRQTGQELAVPFRRDYPERRLELEIHLFHQPAGAVEFRSVQLREEPRPAGSLPVPPRFSDEFIRMCGWCKRIAAPEWVEVEVAIRRLKLLEADEIRRVTHSICPPCAEKLIKETQG